MKFKYKILIDGPIIICIGENSMKIHHTKKTYLLNYYRPLVKYFDSLKNFSIFKYLWEYYYTKSFPYYNSYYLIILTYYLYINIVGKYKSKSKSKSK